MVSNSAASDEFTEFTEHVISTIGDKASPRIKEVFPNLIKHIHAFLVESDVTTKEWLQACELLIEAGKVSNEKRNEMILVSDIFGIESLCDMLDHKRAVEAAKASNGATSEVATFSAILGPFYRQGVPVQPNGTTIIRQDEPNMQYCHLSVQVTGREGKPVANAAVDVWHDAPDGFYDAQDESKPEYHCRGRFQTDSEGKIDLICGVPVPYPIPYDYSAGKLLTLMDRHPYRPAHIHLLVEADGYKTLVTQLYDRKSKYLEDDAVYGVKPDIIIDFKPLEADSSWKPPKDLADRSWTAVDYVVKLVPTATTNGVH